MRRSFADDVVHRVTDDALGDDVTAASEDGFEGQPVEALLEVIEQVVELGRARGYVTADELAGRTGKLENADAVIDVITLRLAEISVPVIETDEATDLVESISPSEDIELFTNHVSDVDLSGISLDDPVRLYLREIGRVPLLTGVQEVTLAQAMERGDYLFRIRRELFDSNPVPLSSAFVARVI
ncbi:MAG TPA: sigma-70 factor domain-containing protein, partial [Nitrolancea sp.]|nr:sigma-70 factor domain-containing protein [Nitrolancea sp.]